MDEVRTERIPAEEVPSLIGTHIKISRTAWILSSVVAREKLDLEPVYHNVGCPAKYPPELIEKIRKERREGYSVSDIATRHKMPLRTAYYFLKE